MPIGPIGSGPGGIPPAASPPGSNSPAASGPPAAPASAAAQAAGLVRAARAGKPADEAAVGALLDSVASEMGLSALPEARKQQFAARLLEDPRVRSLIG